MDPVMAAHKLLRHAEVEVILTMTCRDRNRLALTSQMLGAAAAGVETLLIVSGDFISLGDHPGAKPVYDLDSVQALQLARGLSQGQDLAGHDLAGAPSFALGAALSPQAEPRGAQMLKLRKKLQAGAEFVMTMPLTDQDTYQELRAGIDGVKLIAGVAVDDPASRDTAAGLVKQLKESGADGVHISMAAAQDDLPAFLSACGL
jgi:5,10-methylenetetrahydrofolate reductase